MSTVDKKTIAEMDARIRKAVEDICADMGLVANIGSPKNNSLNIRYTIQIEPKTDRETERQLFMFYAKAFGGEPDWFGQTINRWGNEYTIAGVRPKAKKYHFLIRREKDGELMCLDADRVRRCLASSNT